MKLKTTKCFLSYLMEKNPNELFGHPNIIDWVAQTTEINFLTVLDAEVYLDQGVVLITSLLLACRKEISCYALTWREKFSVSSYRTPVLLD